MRGKVFHLFENSYSKINKNYFSRALHAIYLFDYFDNLQHRGYPDNWFHILESQLKELSKYISQMDLLFDFSRNKFDEWDEVEHQKNKEDKTGEVYYKLWKNFNKSEYFDETCVLLKKRFTLNNISFDNLGDVLDAGCGSGRYSIALKKMGAKTVTGVDISNNSIDFAKKNSPFNENEVNFKQSNVLDLPFLDNQFDFVFSNGVLHHTVDPQKGIKELYKVLKKDGCGWLYLYGGKNSLFWDIVDFCRKLVKDDVPQVYIQSLMKCMGYPPGRIFHRNDFFYVPIHQRYFSSEVEEMLREAGFDNFRRLKRGVTQDWDEIIHSNPQIDPYIYGEGEMRFLIQRKN